MVRKTPAKPRSDRAERTVAPPWIMPLAVGLALAAPLLVGLWLAAAGATGAWEAPLTVWGAGSETLRDAGDGIEAIARPEAPARLLALPRVPRGAAQLTFDIEPAQPLPATVWVRVGLRRENMVHTLDVSDRIARRGRSTVEATIDELPALARADELGIEILSPAGENRFRIARARLRGAPWGERLRETVRRFAQPMPLTRKGNNLIESPTILGRGVLVLFWVGLVAAGAAVAAAVGLVRLNKRRCPLGRPLATVLLTTVAMAATRNWVTDRLEQARTAAVRRADAADRIDYLGRLEADLPWFGPALAWLAQQPPPASFAVRLPDAPGMAAAARRLAYYAAPRPAAEPAQADLLLVWGVPGPDDPTFQRAADLPGGMVAYRRVRP